MGSLLKKGSSGRAAAIVFSGAFANLLINMGAAPILSRIFSRSDFGMAALFGSVVAISALIATATYPMAITVSRSDNTAKVILQLTVVLALIGSIITPVIVYGVALNAPTIDQLAKDPLMLVALAFAVFLAAMSPAFSNLGLRQKKFSANATSNTLSAAAEKSVAISVGLLMGGGGLFLIAANQVGVFVKGMMLNISTGRIGIGRIRGKRLVTVAKTLSSYPMYVLPSNILRRFSQDMPLYFLLAGSGLGLVGAFAFANSMMTAPFNLIQSSISPVFLRRAAELKRSQPQKISAGVLVLRARCMQLCLIPALLIATYGESIFAFIFSDEWRVAGQISSLLAPVFVLRALAAPLSGLYRVFNRERTSLMVNIIGVVARSISLGMGVAFMKPLEAVALFSAASCAVYVVNLYQSYGMADINNRLSLVAFDSGCSSIILIIACYFVFGWGS
jgi:O-antigen/teichoic acid export membrane protein